MSIESDVQKLDPGTLIELFELDATAIGGSLLRWHNGINELGNDVVWDGETYSRFPVEISDVAKQSSGTIPRPKLRTGNANGLISALVRENNGLVGAKVTRHRTFYKYLDAVNYPDGINPSADPNVEFPVDVWTVDRKSAENYTVIEFELSAAFDVSGVKLPRRQCIQNVCPWGYRSAECGYTGGAVATKSDAPTTNLALDSCGKRLRSCKLRFGTYGQLPYGGFPGVGLVR